MVLGFHGGRAKLGVRSLFPRTVQVVETVEREGRGCGCVGCMHTASTGVNDLIVLEGGPER